MIFRRIGPLILDRLRQLPAVALLGPRQAGKTTLAHAISSGRPSIYLDLESPYDREKIADPIPYLSSQEEKLVILDEVQRVPELFSALRGLIDAGRRHGKGAGRFLLLGSASADLLRQSETLAGRIAYVELSPFDILEVPAERQPGLWVRGGFPESFLADSSNTSLVWRENFIRTYLERDIPQLGPRIPATTLRRFWTMLAHAQGGIFNGAHIARSLAVDGKTVIRYLDLMADLMLVRRLQPFQANIGKRLVKSPKVYLRDSGVVHALLRISDEEELLGHPVAGGSWEGHVIENLARTAPEGTSPLFYRTSAGAEIDLLLEIPRHGLWAIDIKRGSFARPEKGFLLACADLKPAKRWLVNAGVERYSIGEGIEGIGMRELARLLTELT
jgi:predicted AAA+ superfamily ATPase